MAGELVIIEGDKRQLIRDRDRTSAKRRHGTDRAEQARHKKRRWPSISITSEDRFCRGAPAVDRRPTVGDKPRFNIQSGIAHRAAVARFPTPSRIGFIPKADEANSPMS
jgi:hypothetical protein